MPSTNSWHSRGFCLFLLLCLVQSLAVKDKQFKHNYHAEDDETGETFRLRSEGRLANVVNLDDIRVLKVYLVSYSSLICMFIRSFHHSFEYALFVLFINFVFRLFFLSFDLNTALSFLFFPPFLFHAFFSSVFFLFILNSFSFPFQPFVPISSSLFFLSLIACYNYSQRLSPSDCLCL